MSHNAVVPAADEVTVHEYLTIRRIRQRHDLERVHPVGEVDLCTAQALRDALADTDHVPKVLVDLSQVDFLALIGVHVLRAVGERRAAANLRFVVVAPKPATQRVLGLTDVAAQLEIYASGSSALSALA